jgi:ubiquitin-protein ligase E3 C
MLSPKRLCTCLNTRSCLVCSLVFHPSSEEQSQLEATDVSPRLGVLNNIPFTIPVDVRKSIFQRFVANDMVRDKSSKTRVSLRKESIAQDAFDKLEGVDIKAPIEITIINEIGQEE